MVPGAAGVPQPMCLALGLFWSSGILLLFRSPQLEGGLLVQLIPLVVPDKQQCGITLTDLPVSNSKTSSVFTLTVRIGKLFGPSLLFLARIVAFLYHLKHLLYSKGGNGYSQPVSLCTETFGNILHPSPSVFLTPCAVMTLWRSHLCVFIFMRVRGKWLKVWFGTHPLMSHVKSITQQKLQSCAFKKQTCFPTKFNRYPNAQKP